MDRNITSNLWIIVRTLVALRKESVDRNARPLALSWAVSVSLSARRAWIEIAKIVFVLLVNGVALRKESVDRNGYLKLLATLIPEVALRKESVDRNLVGSRISAFLCGRSPQGERG